LFVSAGRLDRALALHEREEALLTSPAERAESLRAQTELLAQQGKLAEAARRARQATELAPDHPALLAAAVDAATDAAERARLLGRPAQALAELQAAPDAAHDAEALALCTSLAEEHGTADLLAALRARAAASPDASERADLKALASSMVADPLEQERLLSEA